MAGPSANTRERGACWERAGGHLARYSHCLGVLQWSMLCWVHGASLPHVVTVQTSQKLLAATCRPGYH